MTVVGRALNHRMRQGLGRSLFDTHFVQPYIVFMDLTLSIDEDVLVRAQAVATRKGTSVDRMIHEYLEELVTKTPAEETIAKLEELWRSSVGDSAGQTWTREDLHDRANVR